MSRSTSAVCFVVAAWLAATLAGLDARTAQPATGPSVTGKTLFIAACGSCHTLAAARTRGRKGPSLDEEGPSYGDVVEKVIEGGGGMPSLGKTLTRRQIAKIAAFVSTSSARTGGDG